MSAFKICIRDAVKLKLLPQLNANTTCLFVAYTADEIDEKTKSFRASAKYTVGDDATSLDVRFLSLLCLAFAYMLVHVIKEHLLKFIFTHV